VDYSSAELARPLPELNSNLNYIHVRSFILSGAPRPVYHDMTRRSWSQTGHFCAAVEATDKRRARIREILAEARRKPSGRSAADPAGTRMMGTRGEWTRIDTRKNASSRSGSGVARKPRAYLRQA
jgi:hypothetical protein